MYLLPLLSCSPYTCTYYHSCPALHIHVPITTLVLLSIYMYLLPLLSCSPYTCTYYHSCPALHIHVPITTLVLLSIYMYLLPLLSCSPYTCNRYTVQFQFTGHSLDLLDNVLYDWLFPHHCSYSSKPMTSFVELLLLWLLW